MHATIWLELLLAVMSCDLQIRCQRKPDGVCLVVGSCARGFKDNSTSDVIYSSSSVKKVGTSEAQYFWEVIVSKISTFFRGVNIFCWDFCIKISLNVFQAFPSGSGPMDRTTYMFTYVDPQPGSPKLEELLEEYWDLLPNYQVIFLIFRQ